MNKKTKQLGMNASTASGRLVKDILWKYIVKCGDNHCCKCGEEMARENFSIEHLTPWLDSEDPIKLFFDLDNIAFSHHLCNIGSARRPHKGVIKHGSATGYKHHGCRCEACTKSHSEYKQKRRASGREAR